MAVIVGSIHSHALPRIRTLKSEIAASNSDCRNEVYGPQKSQKFSDIHPEIHHSYFMIFRFNLPVIAPQLGDGYAILYR